MKEEEKVIDYNNHKIPYFLVTPENSNKKGLILIHEIWGLNDNIRDISRRFGKEGYTVLAPDLLAELPDENRITPDILLTMRNPKNREESQEKMKSILKPIQSNEFLEISISKTKECFRYLKNIQNIPDIGIIGFCFGGTYCFALSMFEKDLKASIPFYGRFPFQYTNNIEDINCKTLAFYGEEDTELITSIPDIKSRMDQYGKDFEYIVYPNCGHAFFNEKNLGLYNKEAAQAAWDKTLEFLKENL